MSQILSLLLATSNRGDLVVSLLMDMTLKSTVILLLAGFVAVTLQHASAAMRHLVWSAAIGLLLALPLLSLVLPAWRILPAWPRSAASPVSAASVPEATGISLPPAQQSMEQFYPEPPAGLPARLRSPQEGIAEITAAKQFESPSDVIARGDQTDARGFSVVSGAWTSIVTGVWFAGCLLLVTRLALAGFRLRRASRLCVKVPLLPIEPLQKPSSAERSEFAVELRLHAGDLHGGCSAVDGETLQEVSRIRAAAVKCMALMHVSRIELLLEPGRSIPIVWGLLRSRLQLPREAIHWSSEQLESVMLHELAHVRRRDLLVLAITQLVCAMNWFNPVVWFAACRLHIERERACDDLVLGSGVRPSLYAQHLLDVATALTFPAFTQACGLAMARNSSLSGRIRAVLSADRNRRSVSARMMALLVAAALTISIPVAMLRASEESGQAAGGSDETSVGSRSTGASVKAGDFLPGIEQNPDWSDPVNGLRAAVRIRTLESAGSLGRERRICLVLQNVSAGPVRFCDAEMPGGDALLPDVDKRSLYLRKDNEVLFALSSADPTHTDITLHPGGVVELDLFQSESGTKEGLKTGDQLAEGMLKYPAQTLSVTLQLKHAPAGAWTGKLTTPATRGLAVEVAEPEDRHAQSLLRYFTDRGRLNGAIPGGLINQLHLMVQEFIRNNSGDQYGGPYARKMQPLLVRFANEGDRSPAEVTELLTEIAAVSSIPLERTLEKIREGTLQRGRQLPDGLKDANWGDVLPGGLRMAWMLDPKSDKYPLGTAVQSRVILHNSGDEPVVFVTRSFHLPEHAAKTLEGAAVRCESTHWTTLGRPEPFRLHPGEYCEVHAPGIAVGTRNPDFDDWSNIRPGTWVLANEDDDIVFQPGEVLLTGDHNDTVDSDWWVKFIENRVSLDSPLPTDPKEREVILFRVVSDLFGNSPSPEEAAEFLADNSAEAVNHLAVLLSERPWHTSVAGPIRSGNVRFRVLPEDPDASTRLRVAQSPGRFNLGDEIRLDVSRPPQGKRLINEASIVWYPPGKDAITIDVALPDGENTWAAFWVPTSSVLWVAESEIFRRYDFSQPDALREEQVRTDEVPAEIRQTVQDLKLVKPEAPQAGEQERPAAAAPTTVSTTVAPAANTQPAKVQHEVTARLLQLWQEYARTDGQIPGALLGTVSDNLKSFVQQSPDDPASSKFTELLSQFDVTHDWPLSDTTTLLDRVSEIHEAPLHWAESRLEFSQMKKIRAGASLPPELQDVAWGPEAPNGLRVAWILEPAQNKYFVGTVLTSRVAFHNSGEKPIVLKTETWHQDDRHQARDADDREIKVGGVWFTGLTPSVVYRLAPGEYVEVKGHGIGIGAGQYTEELSTGSVGAWIEAKAGDKVHFSTMFNIIGNTRWMLPGDPAGAAAEHSSREVSLFQLRLGDPADAALHQAQISERIAVEAPLPVSEADRRLLITRVTRDLFGVLPTESEIDTFVRDQTTDALTHLATRLQQREYLPPFNGTVESGTSVFDVLPEDPAAAAKPRRAVAPGRYVLSDSVHLAVQQITTSERFGAPEIRTNNAKILFLSPDPRVESPYPPFEIKLPDGHGRYAILWKRGAGHLLVVEAGSIRTVDFSDPANVSESQAKMNLAPEFQELVPDSLR